jgi:hypothetical protein
MGIVLLLLVLAVLIVGGLTIAFALGGVAVGKNAKKSMELVPGVPAKAPASWFGSHEAEAKLFRRLQEAVRGIHAMGEANPQSYDTVASVEHQALRLEQQMVATSHIADRLKTDVIAQLDAAVAQIEEIAAAVIGRESGILNSGVKNELDSLAERLDLMDRARAEVDEVDRGEPGAV